MTLLSGVGHRSETGLRYSFKDFVLGSLLPRHITLFWERVDRTGGDLDCWPWRGALTKSGYGLWGVRFDGRGISLFAHRAAFVIAGGSIPPGHLIRHLCHNKICCNPSHLATGTAVDNAADQGVKFNLGGGNISRDLPTQGVLL